MKRVSFAILLSFFPLFALSADPAGPVTIAINAWEPIKSETAPYGVLAVIAREAFALEGVEVAFQVAPWKRGYDNAEKGIWNGIVGWNRTAEREKIFFITSPLLLEDVVFFHRRDLDFSWKTPGDWLGLTIGVIGGYNYGTDMAKAILDGTVTAYTTSSEEQSILMLQKDRFDLWPSEVDVGQYLIDSTLPPDQASRLTYDPEPLIVSDLCLLLSKKIPENAEYLRLFEKGLAALKASGRYRKIIEEYLPGSQSLKYAR